MRLLNTRSLTLTTFMGDAPQYVILSHRWEEEELIFDDVIKVPISDTSSPARVKRGFAKVQGTCALALKDGFDWVWIDSCCIDKSSSAELQEAINSMFRWYQEAQICYAYLSDVPDGVAGLDVAFRKSLWFTRGWTLQELLAPCSVEFYAADWTLIGSKTSRADEIASITGIDLGALKNDWDGGRDKYRAAEKMSWAAHRHVTRTEDMAYCLLGLFDANMPLLYGEGGHKAFRRLQEVVFESEADYTLFLFTTCKSASTPFLAKSVGQFCRRKDCVEKPTCLPGHVTYSQMRPALGVRLRVLDDDYLKLIKGGVKLKVPRIKYRSTLIHSLSPDGTIPQPSPASVLALLPLTLEGYEHYVFGILLTRLSSSNYARCNEAPMLVNTEKLLDHELEPRTWHVFDHSRRNPASLQRQWLGTSFHSSSFQVSSWSCTMHSYEHPKISDQFAVIRVPEGDHFTQTIKMFSHSLGVSLNIVLGNFPEELRLKEVEVQGDGPTPRSASQQNGFTDLMAIPLVSTQGCISVALRRLRRHTNHVTPSDSLDFHYRVDVGYLEDNIDNSEPQKLNAEAEHIDVSLVSTTATG